MSTALRVLIMGPTGSIGSGLVRHCVDDPRVGTVTAMSRRPLAVSHPKLRVMIVKNFLEPDPFADDIARHDACFCALGVSQTQVSDPAQYREITVGYPLAIGKVLNARNPTARYAFVSGQGTDATGRSRFMWARVKGEAENELRTLYNGRLTVLRPGYVRPIGAPTLGLLDRVLIPLSVVLRPVLPGAITSTLEIARVMLRAATVGDVPPLLENRDIRRVAAMDDAVDDQSGRATS